MKRSYNKGLVQTVFSNIHDGHKKRERNFYGVIEIGGVNTLHTYETKFRSEAAVYFEEVARLNHGRVDTISTF